VEKITWSSHQTCIAHWQLPLQELKGPMPQTREWCSTQLRFYSTVTTEDKEDTCQSSNSYPWPKSITISMTTKSHSMKGSFTRMTGSKQLKSKCYHSYIPHCTPVKCSQTTTERISSPYVYPSSPSECTSEELTRPPVSSDYFNLQLWTPNHSQKDFNGSSIPVRSQNNSKSKLPPTPSGIWII